MMDQFHVLICAFLKIGHWPRDSEHKWCKNSIWTEGSSHGQTNCQARCLGNPNCTGIAYSHKKQYSHVCVQCKDDVLSSSLQYDHAFDFYRIPGEMKFHRETLLLNKNYLLTIFNRVHFTFATIIGPWATSRDTTCDPKGSQYRSLDSAKAACADDHNCFGIFDTACKGKFLDLCRGGAQVKRCTRPCHFWSCPGHGYCSQWGSPSSGYEYPCIHYKPGTGRSYILLRLHFKY